MRPRTRRLLHASALSAVLAMSACVPPPKPAPAPTPAPAPAPVATPTPPPLPPPPLSNWMDAPQSPGDWSYTAGTAVFGLPGQPAVTLRCDRAARAVELVRRGGAPGPMVVRSEWEDRTINAAAGTTGSVARLSSQDRLLDAIAFSKGRFAVESPGLETLYVPAWPEVIRVIEDCR